MLLAVETWFDGIDRAAVWHRRLSVAGLVLLAPHVMFSSGRQPPLTAGADDGSPLGGPLAQIGAWGLLALAAWAIAPRWCTMLSGPGPQLLRIADRLARTGTMPRCTTTGSPQ